YLDGTDEKHPGSHGGGQGEGGVENEAERGHIQNQKQRTEFEGSSPPPGFGEPHALEQEDRRRALEKHPKKPVGKRGHELVGGSEQLGGRIVVGAQQPDVK